MACEWHSHVRAQLLETGYVYKENFKGGSDSEEDKPDVKYKKERKSNKAIKIKRSADTARKEGCKKSFDVWRIKKEMCERATKALACIDPPTDPKHDIKNWIDVGKQLKAIDRNLYNDWLTWSNGYQSGYKCQVLWDFFPPKCCDVHSAAYSGMRETFLKLLRPGLDYEKVFIHQCKRKWYKLERYADAEEKDFEEVLKVSGGTNEACYRLGATGARPLPPPLFTQYALTQYAHFRTSSGSAP